MSYLEKDIITESFNPVTTEYGLNEPDFNDRRIKTNSNTKYTIFKHKNILYKVTIQKINTTVEFIFSTSYTNIIRFNFDKKQTSISFGKIVYIYLILLKDTDNVEHIVFRGITNKLKDLYQSLSHNENILRIMKELGYVKTIRGKNRIIFSKKDYHQEVVGLMQQIKAIVK